MNCILKKRAWLARSVPVWMESEEDSRISINRIHH